MGFGWGLVSASVFISSASSLGSTSIPPYSYCSKDNCSVIRGAQNLFFGILPDSVARTCVDPHFYAMTFDDGPTENWDELFGILEQYQVKATFFINGRNLDDPTQRARVLRAHQLGHQVSNHTTNHTDLMKLDERAMVEEVEGTRSKIVEILGGDERAKLGARVVRPPFGYVDQRVANILAKNHFLPVRWNSDRYDWELEKDQTATYLRRFQQHLSFLDSHAAAGLDTSIIDLNHDRARVTLDSLPFVIPALKERGYRFVTVSECIGLP